MKKTAAILLAVLCLLFSGVSAGADGPCVALTFDDGPSGEITDYLIRGLEERGVKATFFLCCYRVTQYPQSVKDLAESGHELAVHGATHKNFTALTGSQVRNEILCTAQAIRDLTGIRATLVRPPQGKLNDLARNVMAEEGCSVILWSVDPMDWDKAHQAAVVDHVVSHAKDGDVILLHDLSRRNADAAFAVIDRLRQRGFTFCTVSELAARVGVELLPGQVYRAFPAEKS